MTIIKFNVEETSVTKICYFKCKYGKVYTTMYFPGKIWLQLSVMLTFIHLYTNVYTLLYQWKHLGPIFIPLGGCGFQKNIYKIVKLARQETDWSFIYPSP